MNIQNLINAANHRVTEVNIEEFMAHCTEVLSNVPLNGQYKAIEPMVTPAIIVALKRAIGSTDYMTTNQAIWLVVNAYNDAHPL